MKTFSIVASNHIPGAEDFVKTLQAGVDATLVREPNNPFDRNAVAVWIDGQKVGHVPKAQNKALAAFIDQSGANMPELAMDAVAAASGGPKAIPAKFVRSPNSGFPMVSVSE